MNNFASHYSILKKMMECTSEEEYDELAEKASSYWYVMTREERDITIEMIRIFRFIQQARPWIHEKLLRYSLDDIVPKVNREQVFPW